jgi:hypothetical protein
MKTLKYQLQGQNLVETESGEIWVLTNGEFKEVSLMISFYYLILSKMLVVDDWLYITSGFNCYLETFTYGKKEYSEN